MSHGSGSSVIPVAVFIAILLIVLPVSAAHFTPTQSTVALTLTTAIPVNTTVVPTLTTAIPVNTTVVPTLTTAIPVNTTVVPTLTTATPGDTTGVPALTTATPGDTTGVPTPYPTVSATETIATGSVNVYSSPTGASILIDGIYSGATPKTVNEVAAGNHILQLELSGYYNYEGSIYIVPGQTTEGYGTLQPMNQVTSAAPTVTIPVIVPVVTTAPVPSQDTGLLGNTSVLVAIISAISVLIVAAVSIFTHITPPKKE
jgi:PEGA domain